MKKTDKFLNDKNSIECWLDDYKVDDYIVVHHKQYGFCVDVYGDVNLLNRELTSIPVKFRKVDGYFICSHNQLINLHGAPQIVEKQFNCAYNALTSLQGAPHKVGTTFNCSNNQLTSLQYGPEHVGEFYLCSDNQLMSLEFCPKTVGLHFLCSGNQNLGEVQKIVEFKEIFKIHKTIENIKVEKNKLKLALNEVIMKPSALGCQKI